MGQARPSATYFSCMLSSLASCVIVSGFRAALDLDTYPLSNLIRPRCAERAKRGRGKPVLIMHTRHISRTQSFQQNRHIIFLLLLLSTIIVFTHAMSLDRCRFSKIPHYFSCPCSTEALGIAHKPPRTLYCKNSGRQKNKRKDTQTK